MPAPNTIDEYIHDFAPEVQDILRRICETVRQAAPAALETISYGMPTFKMKKVIIHFGAFNGHIGLYPPVREPSLAGRIKPYLGEKGNLRFPFYQPVPYDLIADIVAVRVGAGQA